MRTLPPKLQARRAERGLLILALAAPAGLGCGGADPPVVAKPAPAPKPKPPPTIEEPPPPPPARWVSSGETTAIGPVLDEGTLVLLGGRRVLVGKDGSVRPEAATSPEPLVEIIVAPLGNRSVVVARSARTVYRLDDPLGPPKAIARAATNLVRMGALPGAVAVWDSTVAGPHVVDLETGKSSRGASLPLLPLRAVAFRDAKHGAGIFDAVGLAVTTDGGASWKPALDPHGDARRVWSVRLEGGALWASPSYSTERVAPIDPVTATLGAYAKRQERNGEARLLRWVRATGLDPLELAVSSGVESPKGGVLVGSDGLFARVDTKSGAILELAEYSERAAFMGTCAATRAGRVGMFGCLVPSDDGPSDVLALFRLPLDAAKLEPGRPTLLRGGEEARVTPSGAAMTYGGCEPDEDGVACVLQPDGSFATLDTDIPLAESGAGPLADGRLAFVRGLDAPGGDAEAEEEPGAPTSKRSIEIVALDKAGREDSLGTLTLEASVSYPRFLTPVTEGEDRTLRFSFVDERGAYVGALPRKGEAAPVRRLEAMTGARLHGRLGVAVGGESLKVTLDGGETWTDASLPGRVREAIVSSPNLKYMDDPSAFAVSEVGAKIEGFLRIGWGPGEASPEEPVRGGLAPTLPPPPGATPARDHRLVCTPKGASAGTPAHFGPHDLVPASPPPPRGALPVKGPRVTTATGTIGFASSMSTLAALEERPAPAGRGAPIWTLRWFNQAEQGARPRSWTGPMPKEIPSAGSASLRGAASSGGAAVFTIAAGTKTFVARPKGGSLELAEVSFGMAPMGDVAFGAGPSPIVAWSRDGNLIAWPPGEAPRVVAEGASSGARAIGQPTRESIPLLLSVGGASLLQKVPISPSSARPPVLPIDGWTRVADVRGGVAKLPACAPKAPGERFWIQARGVRVRVDGSEQSSYDAAYEVKVDASGACVARVAAIFSPRWTPPLSHGASAPKRPLAYGFVRADFLGKRFEGGERGRKGRVSGMTCALEPRP